MARPLRRVIRGGLPWACGPLVGLTTIAMAATRAPISVPPTAPGRVGVIPGPPVAPSQGGRPMVVIVPDPLDPRFVVPKSADIDPRIVVAKSADIDSGVIAAGHDAAGRR